MLGTDGRLAEQRAVQFDRVWATLADRTPADLSREPLSLARADNLLHHQGRTSEGERHIGLDLGLLAVLGQVEVPHTAVEVVRRTVPVAVGVVRPAFTHVSTHSSYVDSIICAIEGHERSHIHSEVPDFAQKVAGCRIVDHRMVAPVQNIRLAIDPEAAEVVVSTVVGRSLPERAIVVAEGSRAAMKKDTAQIHLEPMRHQRPVSRQEA